MTDTYDLYVHVNAIAKAIVMDSKGFGFRSLDAEVVKADVDKAAKVASVATNYWSASNKASKAREKFNAAKTLSLDTAPYEAELADAVRRKRRLRRRCVKSQSLPSITRMAGVTGTSEKTERRNHGTRNRFGFYRT
jgi:hypothetical protein